MPLTQAIADKEHIIWDWNGTILDDVQYCVDTINPLLQQHQLSTISVERYRQLFEFPIRNYYDKLGFDYSRQSFEDLCHHFVDRYMEGVHCCEPYAAIEGLLAAVKVSGKTQSLLSATDQPNLEMMVQRFQYVDHFDFVYGIDNKLAASKLARGRELIVQSQISPEKTLMIGDTLHDLEVGLALGVEVVLLSHGHQSHGRLSAQHHRVLALK